MRPVLVIAALFSSQASFFVFDKKKDRLSPLPVAVSDSQNLQGARSLTLDPKILQAAGWAPSGEEGSAGPEAPADP